MASVEGLGRRGGACEGEAVGESAEDLGCSGMVSGLRELHGRKP